MKPQFTLFVTPLVISVKKNKKNKNSQANKKIGQNCPLSTHHSQHPHKSLSLGGAGHRGRHRGRRGAASRAAPPLPSAPLPSPLAPSTPPRSSPVSSASRHFPLRPGAAAPPDPVDVLASQAAGCTTAELHPTRPLSLVPVSVSRCPVPQPAISDLSRAALVQGRGAAGALRGRDAQHGHNTHAGGHAAGGWRFRSRRLGV